MTSTRPRTLTPNPLRATAATKRDSRRRQETAGCPLDRNHRVPNPVDLGFGTLLLLPLDRLGHHVLPGLGDAVGQHERAGTHRLALVGVRGGWDGGLRVRGRGRVGDGQEGCKHQGVTKEARAASFEAECALRSGQKQGQVQGQASGEGEVAARGRGYSHFEVFLLWERVRVRVPTLLKVPVYSVPSVKIHFPEVMLPFTQVPFSTDESLPNCTGQAGVRV